VNDFHLYHQKPLYKALCSNIKAPQKTSVNSQEQQQLFVTAFPPFFHFKVFMFAREEKTFPTSAQKGKKLFSAPQTR
jgi:hypothetical protein